MASIRFDLYHAVLDAMAAAGCAPHDPKVLVFDGRLHRYDVEGDRRGRQNGWFVLHDTILPFGSFGSWKTGVTQGWSGGDVEALPPEQRERQRRQMAEIAAQRAAEERKRQAQARERAERLWARASPTVSDRHPYLRNKQVPAIGLRQLRELLLVPVRDGDGTLRSLEFLNPEGGKKFLKGGRRYGGSPLARRSAWRPDAADLRGLRHRRQPSPGVWITGGGGLQSWQCVSGREGPPSPVFRRGVGDRRR
jgi:putative DNA primase/helicase